MGPFTSRCCHCCCAESLFDVIHIAKHYRDVLHILWVNEVLADQPNIIELQFTRVVFGIFQGPFLFNANIQHHPGKYCLTQPTLVMNLCESFYGDNLLT